MSSLQIAILRTFAYYDILEYPLTVEEVGRWLYPQPGVEAASMHRDSVQQAMDGLCAEQRIARRGAYYYLPGREPIVDIRTERAIRSIKLWRRAASTARFLELVPFIRMVAVANTLAIDNVRPESDIDLLIITAPQHIWITRLIVTGIVSLLGYRRHGTKIAGRICLSFYATTDGMDFASLQSEQPDTHLAFWTAQVVPLLDDSMYERYRQANDWVTKLLPHSWEWEWKTKLLAPNSGLRSIKQFYELFFSSPIGAWIESWARERQLKKMDKNVESKAALGTTDVIISEDVLKFHEADRRRERNTAFRRRCEELGIPV